MYIPIYQQLTPNLHNNNNNKMCLLRFTDFVTMAPLQSFAAVLRLSIFVYIACGTHAQEAGDFPIISSLNLRRNSSFVSFPCELNRTIGAEARIHLSPPCTTLVVIDWQPEMQTQNVVVKADQSGIGSVKFDWMGPCNVQQFENKEAFESCNYEKAILLSDTSGFVFSSTAGTYYFGCSIYNHCEYGQKLQLEIRGEDAVETGYTIANTHLRSHAHSSMASTHAIKIKSICLHSECSCRTFIYCLRCSSPESLVMASSCSAHRIT